ncbi:hypothetical protein EJD97_008631 [Solanum chilense]|uniref:Uncharacterized protein n=1 Tax=Solanum chilense TaxID=4083 RepID=A0A6N2BLK7_SOLCI|nr:hypothetical protein EJD97_008631 [Solanum chilense]
MNTRRMTARRLEEGKVNEEIPPQVEQVLQGARNTQVPIVEGGNDVPVVPLEMTNGEIRETLLALALAITTYVNRCVDPRVNAMESTMTSRLRYFVRMNPLIFLGSKVGEYPQ